ncbi:molybdopterin molybdotransferase MoeA [soil metagenome]
MTTVAEAFQIVLATKIALEREEVALSDSLGKILQEDIFADRDFPPFNRVTMDGIALNFSQWDIERKPLQVEGIQKAGEAQKQLQNSQNCLEVMTGAVLPENTDTVVKYEDIEIININEEKFAKIYALNIKQGQNIHKQGKDRKKGDTLLRSGTKISSAEIAVAATVGKGRLMVMKQPKIAVISTGDELVEVNQTPLPHQIRKSNSYSLKASLREIGLECDLYHISDNKEKIYHTLSSLFVNYQVIILSGGVSMGKADFIPQVLQQLKVEKLFHKILQRPGKPFWFGKSQHENIVFAFPGNPVSTYLCFYRYFKPWFLNIIGQYVQKEIMAELEEDVVFDAPLTYFIQVKVRIDKGKIYAFPFTGHGSGDFANLLLCDGFLELSAERSEFKAGELYPLFLYRNILH